MELAEARSVDLARASTYYINPSRAEAACLPLQASLAAGRPAIAPAHTGMADYFHDALGFVVASHPEPTCWPHDLERGYRTSWHRLVWQSFHDQILASYEIAKSSAGDYQSLALQARRQMAGFASCDRVWPLLSAALNSIAGGGTGEVGSSAADR